DAFNRQVDLCQTAADVEIAARIVITSLWSDGQCIGAFAQLDGVCPTQVVRRHDGGAQGSAAVRVEAGAVAHGLHGVGKRVDGKNGGRGALFEWFQPQTRAGGGG